MPLTISELRTAAASQRNVLKNLSEAQAAGGTSAFLCHSHKDRDLVQGVINLLSESGWNVYVDWTDSSMPDKPDRRTAERIKARITQLNYFLFLATQNSVTSRWCPWEIGYADGKKDIDRILVIPTTDGASTHGSEYLDLYRRVERSSVGSLAAWQPGEIQNGVFVRNL